MENAVLILILGAGALFVGLLVYKVVAHARRVAYARQGKGRACSAKITDRG